MSNIHVIGKCKKCGSHAINHNLHGRDGSDADLCDVCYWRKRAVDKNHDEQADPVQRKVCQVTDFKTKETAPKDGTQILADLGWPYLVIAATC